MHSRNKSLHRHTSNSSSNKPKTAKVKQKKIAEAISNSQSKAPLPEICDSPTHYCDSRADILRTASNRYPAKISASAPMPFSHSFGSYQGEILFMQCASI